MAQFYVSCPVGFEAELAQEMKSFWFEMMDMDGLPTRAAFPELETLMGGLQFETEDYLGYQINFFSKLANRVLIRIAKFNARYFDQFEKELQKVTIEKWLEPQALKFKVESHKSRLNNEKSLVEAMTHSLAKKKFTVSEKADESAPMLYLRIEKDNVIVSLDTSGDHLHKRGYATFRGEAPLRENLAAMMIKQLLKRTSIDQNVTILDPFVGSGTILFEAASYREAALNRDYTWLKFINRPKLFKSATWSKNYRWLQKAEPLEMMAIDLEEKAIVNIEQNKMLFEQKFPNSPVLIDAQQADSLEVDLAEFQEKPNLWIVTNPPYGQRLAQGEALRILERFEEKLPLAGMIVLHPEDWFFQLQNLKVNKQIEFKNQGLKLTLSVFTK